MRGYDPDAYTKQKRIGLDFDDTLHLLGEHYNGPVPTGEPVSGALAFVLALIELGFTPFVFSTRALDLEGKLGMIHWLHDNGFPRMEVTGEKWPALLYVDDRGFRFNPKDGNGFGAVLELLAGTDVLRTWVSRGDERRNCTPCIGEGCPFCAITKRTYQQQPVRSDEER
jgi:hypothetical protein